MARWLAETSERQLEDDGERAERGLDEHEHHRDERASAGRAGSRRRRKTSDRERHGEDDDGQGGEPVAVLVEDAALHGREELAVAEGPVGAGQRRAGGVDQPADDEEDEGGDGGGDGEPVLAHWVSGLLRRPVIAVKCS